MTNLKKNSLWFMTLKGNRLIRTKFIIRYQNN